MEVCLDMTMTGMLQPPPLAMENDTGKVKEKEKKKGKKKRDLKGRCSSRPLNGGGLQHKVPFLLEDVDCVHSIHNSDQFATSRRPGWKRP